MGRMACTEPQCLYKGTLYLYLYSHYVHIMIWTDTNLSPIFFFCTHNFELTMYSSVRNYIQYMCDTKSEITTNVSFLGVKELMPVESISFACSLLKV